MYLKIRLTTLSVLLCMVVVAIFASAANGQDRVEHAFEAVPQELRWRLVSRLNKYIEYEKTGQYGKLYELLYGANASGDKGTNKETYAASRQEANGRRGTLQEFLPTSVLDLTLNDGDPPTYSITGHARVECGGESVKKLLVIYAKFQYGDWYFSEALGTHRHVD